jgi:hypothetical protein
MANQGDSSSTSTARFGLPIAALEVALPDDLVGTHVRTLIVEPLEDPVLAAHGCEGVLGGFAGVASHARNGRVALAQAARCLMPVVPNCAGISRCAAAITSSNWRSRVADPDDE